MSKIIIGIHGLANKPPADVLSQWWKSAISEGLEKNCGISKPEFDFRMVYWAGNLYKSPMHRDADYWFDKLYNDEPYEPVPKEELKEHVDNWTDNLASATRGGVGKILDSLKDHFKMDDFADWVLGKLAKDLHLYYEGDNISNGSGGVGSAQAVLRGALARVLEEEKGKEIMLIAHSMGTIIAYDVLRDLGMPGVNSGVTVRDFVTIGSPLGLPHVHHKIKEERGYDARTRTPSVVTGSWTNFADRKDPVCADIHLADDYEENNSRIKVKDDVVLNTYHKPGDLDARNHHKSYGYLRTPECSEKIREFLGI